MPWNIRKQGEKYCVINIETGENKGCSSPPNAKEKAISHKRVLYHGESGGKFNKAK